MTYTAEQIAYFFLSKIDSQNDAITPLKLQKLIYYAQAWHCTLFGNPLFNEKIEAWRHGPVVESVWQKFKNIGRNHAINIDEISFDLPNFSVDTEQLLEEINEIYGEHSGSYLEELTHSEQPWIIARGNLPIYAKSSSEITLESMKTFYLTKNTQ